MTLKGPMLHMFCGKIASGKSTLAAELGKVPGAITLAEDVWLGPIYGDQMSTPADFVRCSAQLRQTIGPHIVELLKGHMTVVLDYQANTVESRAWMRGILDQTEADHALHFFDVPDAVCLDRLRKRNEGGEHPFEATEQQFHMFSKHFVAPGADEGFNIVRHEFDG